MSAFREWVRRLAYLIGRSRHDRDLRREMEAHREQLGSAAAFGNSLRLLEEAADVWGWRWLDDAARDMKWAARSLRRRPGFTAVVVASLALVTTSGTFGIEPTDNRAALLAEIERFLDRYDPELKRLRPGATPPDPSPLANAMGQLVSVRGPENLGRFFGDLGTYRTVKTLLQRVAMDGEGRRNALVWISGGMNAPSLARCRDDVNSNAHYCGELAGLIESLGKSAVTAYGVSTGDFGAQTLRDVAELSGGFVVSSRMFDRDLPRLIEDLDHYYLLGFQAENPKDGGLHDLRVEVTRPGLTVRHRRSYRPGEDGRQGRGRAAHRQGPGGDNEKAAREEPAEDSAADGACTRQQGRDRAQQAAQASRRDEAREAADVIA